MNKSAKMESGKSQLNKNTITSDGMDITTQKPS